MTLAFIPVVALGFLFPDRIAEMPATEEKYHSTQGADIVVFVRDGCPHCAAFEEYAEGHDLAVQYYEVTNIDAQKYIDHVNMFNATHGVLIHQHLSNRHPYAENLKAILIKKDIKYCTENVPVWNTERVLYW